MAASKAPIVTLAEERAMLEDEKAKLVRRADELEKERDSVNDRLGLVTIMLEQNACKIYKTIYSVPSRSLTTAPVN